MRPLGEFEDEDQASLFTGFLLYKDMEAEMEEEEEGGPWTVWVKDEDKLASAMAELRAFRQNPDDPKYADLSKEGRKRAQAERKEEAKQESRRREENLRASFQDRNRRTGMMTLAFIITCVATFFVTEMGGKKEYTSPFKLYLPYVLEGQVWRLITPIFLHFGFIHILFNMWWLHDLGSLIESRRGTLFFLAFVLLVGVLSNLLQYQVSGGNPHFGGMSGVVYGLFGYVWMKGKYDPGDGMGLPESTVVIMLAWFALCFTGIFGAIANWAHAGGLVTGALWGYLSALRWTGRRG